MVSDVPLTEHFIDAEDTVKVGAAPEYVVEGCRETVLVITDTAVVVTVVVAWG